MSLLEPDKERRHAMVVVTSTGWVIYNLHGDHILNHSNANDGGWRGEFYPWFSGATFGGKYLYRFNLHPKDECPSRISVDVFVEERWGATEHISDLEEFVYEGVLEQGNGSYLHVVSTARGPMDKDYRDGKC